MNKVCRKCLIEKRLSEFRQAPRYKSGVSWCLECCKKYSTDKNREYRAKMSEDEKISRLARRRSNYQKNREYLLSYRKKDRAVFSSYKADAKRRNLIFSLTAEHFNSLINGICNYCGNENPRGVDRLDNAIGYDYLNCVPCCRMCNHMKHTLSKNDFLRHIEKIYTQQIKGTV